MGFIKFILWVLLIYYFFKLVFQGLKAYAIKKIQKQQEIFGQQFGGGETNFQDIFRQQQQQQQQANDVPEGNTVIRPKKESKPKKQTKDLGEYIDYEEA